MVNAIAAATHSQTLAAVVNLNTNPGTYVHWGFIQISASNLIIIGVMILMFVAAILLPFPGHRARQK